VVVGQSRDTLWKGVDSWVIDGIVNGTGRVTARIADASRYAQGGLVRGYALVILGGAVAVLSYMLWLR
jgi:NADH-quinone oxidoreductase subunit L